MRLFITVLLAIRRVESITNVFSGASVSLYPDPLSSTTYTSVSDLAKFCDQQLPQTAPDSWWGYCSGPSSMAWIELTNPLPTTARTIFTTYAIQGSASSVTIQSFPETSFTQTMRDQYSNGLYYTGASFQATSVWLMTSASDWLWGSVRLCSPEILVIDDHPLWQVAGTRSQSFSKNLFDSTSTVNKTYFSTIPEVTSKDWSADSTCFTYTLASPQNAFQLILYLGGMQAGSTTNYKMNQLVLLTGFYLVMGPQNANLATKPAYYPIILNFAGGYAIQDTSQNPISASSSSGTGIYSVFPTTGYITFGVKLYSTSVSTTQICRFMPLGYPCCFVSSITDTSSTVNSYFIHPSLPKTPIQKIFQVGFYIDTAKTITNVLFCSLGITATVTCTTCLSVQPDFTVVITEDGRVTVSISSASFTNIGTQTLKITVIDTRNIEQTLGNTFTFQVTFTTCSLQILTPTNQNYVLGGPQLSQSITTTESDTCLFPVTCSLGTQKPSWVTNNGCTILWSTSDTTQAYTTYTVPITILYSKQPSSQTLNTSFTINLSCVSVNTFTATPVTYMIKSTAGTQTLQATNTCGYSMTYAMQAPLISWVTLSGATLRWYTTDLTISPGSQSVNLLVTYGSNPATNMGTTLVITVQACTEVRTFSTTPVFYKINDPTASQALQVTNTCGYTATFTQLTSPAIPWITLNGTNAQWYTTNVSLALTSYPATFQVSLATTPPTLMQAQLTITLQSCANSITFSTASITYKIKDPAVTQTLFATNTCGYAVSYSMITQTFAWATLSGSVVTISTQDLTLVPGTYSVTFQATFQSVPTTTQNALLNITLQACTNSVTQMFFATTPIVYTIKDTAVTQTLIATNTCGYAVSYSMITQTYAWVSLNGALVSVSSQDLTLAPGTYSVTFQAAYQSAPITTKQAILTIQIQACQTISQFLIPAVQYRINDPTLVLNLAASNTCDYPVTYQSANPTLSWVLLNGSTVSIATQNLALLPSDYQAGFQATFLSSPSSSLQANLVITLLACIETYQLIPPTDQTYKVQSVAASQTILVSDTSSCGYVPTCTLDTTSPSWVTVSSCVVSWQTNDNSLLASPLYLVPIIINLHNQVYQTQFQINLEPCVPTYQFQNVSNVTYELFKPAANQILTYQLTSLTSCGFTPTCSLSLAPTWVTITSNCVVTWQTSNTKMQTPSTFPFKVLLSYVDNFNLQSQITSTDFQIKVTPALTMCATASILPANTTFVQLQYNQKVTLDLTPSDSVSTMFAQSLYCGEYTATWPASQASWLTLKFSGMTVELLQNQYSSSSIDLQVKFSLANYPLVVATQTIQVKASDCFIQSFLPETDSLQIDYTVGDGASQVAMPVYSVTSDCQISFLYLVSVTQLSGQACDASVFSVTTSQFQINLDDESLSGQTLTFGVVATLNDRNQTKNSDLIITVTVAQTTATTTEDGSTSENSATQNQNAQDDSEETSQSSSTPTFSSDLESAEKIPCLKLDQADSWSYQTPTIISQNTKTTDFKLSCPGIQSIFKFILEEGVIKLSLDTTSPQPYPGFFPATFTLMYKNEKTEMQYSLGFEVDCEARFATATAPIRPQPRIAKITGTGTVTISWNTNLQIKNLTTSQKTNNSTAQPRLLASVSNQNQVQADNFQIPGLEVTVKPVGGGEESSSDLGFNCTVQALDPRSITLQLFFSNPTAISTSTYALHELIVTFSDPSLFVSSQNQMSVEKGLRIVTLLPRQQAVGAAQQLKQLNTVAGASKGAMLASLGMPYILSTVLSQLLSVIRSFTIIVHMQATSLMFPTNVVAFFSILAPLVMFDLIPTQNISNKIFKFPDLSNDLPLTLQFNQLGYSSYMMVENLGSLFFLIAAYPIFILVFIILRKILPKRLNNNKVGRKITGTIDSFIKSAFWNFPISFAYESYLIVCIVSFIGLKGLVFRNYQIWAQVFCSVLAVIGVAGSVLFPCFVYLLYRKRIKNPDPKPDPTLISAAERQAIFWIDDIESILEHYFTQKQMGDFMQKYGCLIEEVDLQRVGVNVAILSSLSDMIRKLVIAVALVYFTDKPYFVIFAFNFTSLFFIMFQVYYAPIRDFIEHIRIVVNEATVLVVVYHMFCFTEFVVNVKVQDQVGSSLIYFVIINGFVNVILSLIEPTRKGILYLKKYRLKCTQKKPSAVKPKTQKVVENELQLQSSQIQEQEITAINVALRRQPIVDNGISGLRIADIHQPFSKLQIPEIGTLSPLNIPNLLGQDSLDETRDANDSMDQKLIETFRKRKQKVEQSSSKKHLVPELDSISEVDESSGIESKTHYLIARTPNDA